MNATKSQAGVVIAKGGWKSGTVCPDDPRGKGRHFFTDKSRKPSGRVGEWLITSECKHCGCLIVDCPTIYA